MRTPRLWLSERLFVLSLHLLGDCELRRALLRTLDTYWKQRRLRVVT